MPFSDCFSSVFVRFQRNRIIAPQLSTDSNSEKERDWCMAFHRLFLVSTVNPSNAIQQWPDTNVSSWKAECRLPSYTYAFGLEKSRKKLHVLSTDANKILSVRNISSWCHILFNLTLMLTPQPRLTLRILFSVWSILFTPTWMRTSSSTVGHPRRFQE